MISTDRITTLVLMLIAAFAGGALSHWLLTPSPALSADPEKAMEVGNPKWGRAVTLYLVDEEKEIVRGAMNLQGGSAHLELRNNQEAGRLTLDVTQSGQPKIALMDPAGQTHLEMTVSPDGAPSLRLTGTGRGASLRLSAVETPQIEFVDVTGSVRARFGLDAAGRPSLQMFDEGGKVVWKAP